MACKRLANPDWAIEVIVNDTRKIVETVYMHIQRCFWKLWARSAHHVTCLV